MEKIISINYEDEKLMEVINGYTLALSLLDDYDHQCLKSKKGNKTLHRVTYEEAKNLINGLRFKDSSEVFGIEKEKGKLEGIYAAVYQEVFGKQVYDSVELKAANLLYFLIKDHPFVDGCKRIAATLFIHFLYKNNALYKNDKQVIDNNTLACITLLIAMSNPLEKEVIINFVANLLC